MDKKKKMLKFIWGKGNQPTAERLKIQQQLFGFSKVSPWFESLLLLLNHKLDGEWTSLTPICMLPLVDLSFKL